MNVLVFDIETVPDTATGKRLYELDGLSEQDIGRAMTTLRIQKTGGSDFLPLHLHRVVAISAVLRSGNSFNVWSLGNEDADEAELINRFYDGIERYTPTLVSWNGGGFDLPVLNYRSLLNNVSARRYWEHGDEDREFRFNNYLSRYHWRHIDLMDLLSGFNLRAAAPLNEVAVMLGFPGKMGMSGADVWDTYLNGEIGKIRAYCETDVLNTFLVYLKWESVRGNLDQKLFDRECAMVRAWLKDSGKPHFEEFLEVWERESLAAAG